MFRLPKILLSSDHPDNPWGSSGGARKPSSPPPFGNRQQRGGGNTPPPQMPPFFKNLGDGRPPAQLIGLVLVGILLLWLASGLYRVQPEEHGVVLRFGKYMDTVTESGLHYHLPWPIETVMKPNVTFERRIAIGYRASPYGGEKQDIPEESMMLTGDANIVDLDFVIQWKISDARDFLFNIRNPEATLKRVAESAMREVVGQNRLQDIITDRREDVAMRVKPMMQEIMDSYGAGIMVTQVLIQDASVPPPVLDAFEDVVRATQQAETMRNQAQRYRNEIVPRAQGEAIRLIKEAEAYKEQVVAQAKGDAQRFNDIYGAYAASKNVTRQRLYLDAWDHILKNSDAVILDSAKSGSIPYVNVNELRKTSEPKQESR